MAASDRPLEFSGQDQEVLALRRRLVQQRRELEGQLRHNERIWAGFRRIEIRLIGSRSLRELVDILLTQLPALFTHVDSVSLLCVDPEYELARLLEADAQPALAQERSNPETADLPGCYFISAQEDWLATLFPGSTRPRLGPCNAEWQARLFPHTQQTLASMAIAPLWLRGQIIGYLNQASRDPAHFSADAATDLLEHLAAITAMCIDNAINHVRLKRDGLTDALTGVANRRFFERRLHDEIKAWARHEHGLACLLVDLDHFKKINDQHGHQVGDRALQAVARVLNKGLRATDVLARYGGEEFVLVLPSTDQQRALEIAERLRMNVAEVKIQTLQGEALALRASIGVAYLKPGGQTPLDKLAERLVRAADAALYQAKAAGRNRVVMAPLFDDTHVDLEGLSTSREEQPGT